MSVHGSVRFAFHEKYVFVTLVEGSVRFCIIRVFFKFLGMRSAAEICRV